MRGYRRFVAYVYEYRRGRKEENCGYIRVEARDDDCNMEVHLKCPGLPGDVKGEIYGFVRRQNGMEGYLLQQCRTLQDALECGFETESDQLGQNPVALADLGGMVILTEGGAFFGTEWDDRPIQPDMFFAHSEEKTDNKEIAESEEIGNNIENKNVEETITEDVPEMAKDETQPEKVIPMKKDVQKDEAEGIRDVEAAEIPESDGENLSITAESTVGPEESEVPVSDISEQIPEKREFLVLNRDQILHTQQCEGSFNPFPDGEIRDCRKIQAEDFHCLHPRDRGLRNNRFVTYSYHQFGYLLIGQLSNGRYILGLPGGYDQQERFMAGTFGFPFFKQSPEIELSGARGGYWYRLINTPNFN